MITMRTEDGMLFSLSIDEYGDVLMAMVTVPRKKRYADPKDIMAVIN